MPHVCNIKGLYWQRSLNVTIGAKGLFGTVATRFGFPAPWEPCAGIEDTPEASIGTGGREEMRDTESPFVD